MKKLSILFVLFVFVWGHPAQNKTIDSLTAALKLEKNDTSRVNTLLRISKTYNKLHEFETSLPYALNAVELAEKLNSRRHLARAYKNLGYVYDWIAYTKDGNYSKVDPAYKRALEIYTELKDTAMMADVLYARGYTLDYQSDYPGALKNYLEAIRYFEILKDSASMARLYTLAGESFSSIGDKQKNLDYLLRSKAISKKIKNEPELIHALVKIGSSHLGEDRLDSALFYYNSALDIFNNSKDQKALRDNIVGINILFGRVYYKKNEYSKALEYGLLVLKGDTTDPSINARGLSFVGQCYLALNNTALAEKHYLKALSAAKRAGIRENQSDIYYYLSEVYEKTGKPGKALEYYKRYINLRDTLHNEANVKEITGHQMQAEFDKQQMAEQAEQEKKDAIAKEQLRQQKKLTTIFISGFLIIILFSFFLYRSFLQKKKSNELIKQQNIELEDQKSKVHLQKELLAEKNKEMTDSINYAKRIQNTVLLDPAEFEKKFVEAFLLFRPKDIVSGDFYWLIDREDVMYYATIDCTGHGVPGGFMSMLGNSFLNEIVTEKNITEPGEVLDLLRAKVIMALHQKGAKDGMDAVFCKIDRKKNELSYAAANNPLWFVRNGELTEYPADKQPIGLSEGKVIQYTQHTIPLQFGDRIYTFTDGFADQFGGEKGKKFKYKPFKEMLMTNWQKPMWEQKEIINKTFEDWMGSHEQVDDVTVIGIRV